MGRQLELFEKREGRWTQSVWNGLSPEIREEIVALLARMARARLRASRELTKGKRKGVSHDA
jgi:hypothetical protein